MRNIPNSIHMFQTLEGLQLHAQYIFDRLRDSALANDALVKENEQLKDRVNQLQLALYEGKVGRYNKVVRENKKLRNSLQKLFTKYVQPTLLEI